MTGEPGVLLAEFCEAVKEVGLFFLPAGESGAFFFYDVGGGPWRGTVVGESGTGPGRCVCGGLQGRTRGAGVLGEVEEAS